MWATYKGHLEVVRVLLSHGADPNKPALVVRQYKQDKPYEEEPVTSTPQHLDKTIHSLPLSL